MMNSGAYSIVRKKPGYAGYFHEGSLALILEIDDIYTEEEAAGFFSEVNRRIKANPPEHLADFDRMIIECVSGHNLPIGFSLAGSCLNGDVIYLKTINTGETFIRRGKNIQRIINGDNSASGHIQKNDIVVLSTEYFIKISENLGKITRDPWKSADKIAEKAIASLSSRDDIGTVAVFLDFQESISAVTDTGETVKEKSGGLVAAVKERFNTLNNRPDLGRKKKLTMLFIVAVVIILVWSIGSGYSRKLDKSQRMSIVQTGEQIEKQLQEAADMAFLNRNQAADKIADAKNLLSGLQTKLPAGKYSKELEEIRLSIETNEKLILKKEDAVNEEYYDLAMENKDASGDKIYRWEDNIAILDSGRAAVYVFSVEKKSLQLRSDPSLKKARLIALYNNDVYYYLEDKGIFRINSDGNVRKMMEDDKDWGNIVSVAMYNGNLYLLDKEKDEILKYLGAEDAFGGKSSYFQSGESIDMSTAYSMAIDSSIYIGLNGRVIKFSSGAKQSFQSDFPRDNVSIERVIAAPDLESIYVWDKAGGSLFVFDKQGEYQKEVYSSVLKDAKDMTVYNNSAYVLKDAKIFRINID